jgi:hypothetical protein
MQRKNQEVKVKNRQEKRKYIKENESRRGKN